MSSSSDASDVFNLIRENLNNIVPSTGNVRIVSRVIPSQSEETNNDNENIDNTTIPPPPSLSQNLLNETPNIMKNIVKNKYKKCVITGLNINECDIIKLNPNTDEFEINNYIAIHQGLSNSFRNNKWSINPNTHIIEILEENNYLIDRYAYTRINSLDDGIKINLTFHYYRFLVAKQLLFIPENLNN